MSVLGRRELINRIKSGDVVVTPLLSCDQIGPASIDLRMGNVALMARARGSSHVDPALVKSEQSQNPYLAEMRRQQKHERYELPFGAELLLHPGSLALAPTLEWVRVPKTLVGQVTARSTWASTSGWARRASEERTASASLRRSRTSITVSSG